MDPKFVGPLIFKVSILCPKIAFEAHFLGHKISLPDIFDPTLFLTKNTFGPKNIFWTIILFGHDKLCLTKKHIVIAELT